MDGYVKIARKDQLKSSSGVSVNVEGEEVAVFQIDGDILAVRNTCPHQHFQLLHQGELDGHAVTCPMHGWKFDLQTGRGIANSGNLRTYAVKVIGDDVWVERPEE
ncbi:MAG: Rieske 2Fe-2S domain-containing protein [Nitrososphaera sp.]|nr:Rieske 2Fe-2S domain-containing protein [Nitrososphaera sp.]